MGFRENLRSELEYQDLKVKELAEKTGINRKTIDNYLTKSSNDPSATNAVKIAKTLGVSVEYLVTGSNDSHAFSSVFPQRYRKILENLTELDEIDLSTVEGVIFNLKKRYKS